MEVNHFVLCYFLRYNLWAIFVLFYNNLDLVHMELLTGSLPSMAIWCPVTH